MTVILGIKLEDRTESSLEFQKILTEYGCAIKTRIGLHHSKNGICTNCGIVLIELNENIPTLAEKLKFFGQVNTMTFD